METFNSNTKTDKDSIEKRYLTWGDCIKLVDRLWFFNVSGSKPGSIKMYGVPRGGVYVSLLFRSMFSDKVILVESPEQADVIVDDLIDSGNTNKVYSLKYKKPFYALIDKRIGARKQWIVFPWEIIQDETGPKDSIIRLLQYIGEDPNREGLIETPDRVIKSFNTLYGGYSKKVEDILKVFEDDTSDEMIILKNIEFFSTCEHHMLPFFGKAHIAYIPNGKVVGISKLARILEIYSRRLQIQERLCREITSALMYHLQPLGVACMLEAKHFCMVARGVAKQNSIMVTSSLEGVFKEDPSTRAEFLNLIGR